MDIYQDMADDPATLTSQLFSMPCRFEFFFFYNLEVSNLVNLSYSILRQTMCYWLA